MAKNDRLKHVNRLINSLPLSITNKYFSTKTMLTGWCGRVGKAIDPREAQYMFINHFEYFSATLPQVCIQHDETGSLVVGLTVQLITTARELCQVSLAGKESAKRWR